MASGPKAKAVAKGKTCKTGSIQSQLRSVITGVNPTSAATSADSSQSQPLVAIDDDSDHESAYSTTASGSVSSHSTGIVAGAAEVDVITCIACEEEEKWGESSPYGRDPFKRWCKKCASAYKCRTDAIKKEKSVHGQSDTDKYWRSLSKSQQSEWYRNQKRKQEKGARRQEMAPPPKVFAESSHGHGLQTGRKRINVATTFSRFSERGLLLGKTAEAIVSEWKDLVQDQSISREMLETGRNGERVLALHLFDRVELYSDENQSEEWRVHKKSTAASSADVPGLIEDQAAAFLRARESGCYSVPITEENQPMEWDNELADPTVEEHLCPIPQKDTDFIAPPDVHHPASADLLKLLQSREQSVADAEAAMRQEALQAKADQLKRGELEEKRNLWFKPGLSLLQGLWRNSRSLESLRKRML